MCLQKQEDWMIFKRYMKQMAAMVITVFNNAPQNKQEKWKNIIGGDRYLQCRSNKDIKTVKVFKICRWDGRCGQNCIANE